MDTDIKLYDEAWAPEPAPRLSSARSPVRSLSTTANRPASLHGSGPSSSSSKCSGTRHAPCAPTRWLDSKSPLTRSRMPTAERTPECGSRRRVQRWSWSPSPKEQHAWQHWLALSAQLLLAGSTASRRAQLRSVAHARSASHVERHSDGVTAAVRSTRLDYSAPGKRSPKTSRSIRSPFARYDTVW